MIAEQKPFRAHAFEYACATNDVDHRLTKPKHPWTNGQVERMNRTIKDATVKRYFYKSHDQLRTHLRDFVSAYNFARRLKTLKGLTPYEFVCKAWTSQPQQFKLNPLQQMPGAGALLTLLQNATHQNVVGAGDRHHVPSPSACNPRTCTSVRWDGERERRRSSLAREAADTRHGSRAAVGRCDPKTWSGRCRGLSARRCNLPPVRRGL